MSKENRMVELLEELVKWTKVTSIPNVKKLLLEILSSPEEKIAYQSSDGKKTREEVAKQADVGHTTVGRWWKKWIKAGIAKPVSVQRGTRAERVFSLDDFGIKVPLLKEVKPEIEETEAPIDIGKPVEEGSIQEEMSEEQET